MGAKVPLTFSYPGQADDGVISPRWYAEQAVTFAALRLSADTAPSSTLTVDLLQNGVSVATQNLNVPDETVKVVLSLVVEAGDYLQVEIMSGDGAENVSLELS